MTDNVTIESKEYVFPHEATQPTFPFGMREMQARVYSKRNAQHLLVKAPPASGKSRALMFLALDKVYNQGIQKVIIAVPQLAIGSSFNDTNLTKAGFFADWHVDPKYNLCQPGMIEKTSTLQYFYDDPDAHFLVCSHPTLIAFFDQVKDVSLFNQSLIAIDEFHHVSADGKGNRLGHVIHTLIDSTTAHIVAMTGSYFRGDGCMILDPSDEDLFTIVSYNYYEQLKACRYLKSLRINYAFYTGVWLDSVDEVLDLSKKTILHIPNVNSSSSTHDKMEERNQLLDIIFEEGTPDAPNPKQDATTGFYVGRSRLQGKILRVADLITPANQSQTLGALRKITSRDEVDIILALGMAKEGFDWPFCEHVLTIGYRDSLTEVIQIIGRATRDCKGKSVAYFTNLIKKPIADEEDVKEACNSLLKAISLSLLMEQVLKPVIHFECYGGLSDEKNNSSPKSEPLELSFESPVAKKIGDDDFQSVLEGFYNSDAPKKALGHSSLNGAQLYGLLNEFLIDKYADSITDNDRAIIADAVVAMSCRDDPKIQDCLKTEDVAVEDVAVEGLAGEMKRDNKIMKFTQRLLLNVDELPLNLIEIQTPFQNAYEFLSRHLDAETFDFLQTKVISAYNRMTLPEAFSVWNFIQEFREEKGRKPDINSADDYEHYLATALRLLEDECSKQEAL